MKTKTHTCVPGTTDTILLEIINRIDVDRPSTLIDVDSGWECIDLPVGESIEEIAESVDELREKLTNMKKLMQERKGTTLGEISARKRKETSNMIDGNLLSWIFGLALMGILIVSSYAFYNLYYAVLKKFPSHHTEL